MADTTVNVPNSTTGSPALVDGVIASANNNAFRQAAAIKSADGTDNGLVIGADSKMPTKSVINGTPDYRAGVSGSPRALGAAQCVLDITAHASAAGAYFTIAGGDQIPVPAGNSMTADLKGNWVAPAIVFVGTDSYFVNLVTPV